MSRKTQTAFRVFLCQFPQEPLVSRYPHSIGSLKADRSRFSHCGGLPPDSRCLEYREGLVCYRDGAFCSRRGKLKETKTARQPLMGEVLSRSAITTCRHRYSHPNFDPCPLILCIVSSHGSPGQSRKTIRLRKDHRPSKQAINQLAVCLLCSIEQHH